MKRTLQIIALGLALGTVGIWPGTGAHRGWTETSITVMRTDPVTELQYPETRKQFVAGVEVLGLGLGGAGALVAASFLLKRKSTLNPKN